MNTNHLIQEPVSIPAPQPFNPQEEDSTGFTEAWSADTLPEPPAERRRKPRVVLLLPARVRGSDSQGMRFEAGHDTAQLQDLSSNGLKLFLKHQVETGQKLFVLFPAALGLVMGTATLASSHVHPSSSHPATSHLSAPPQIAVIGIVRRCQMQADASCSVGVEIMRHRFVYGT